MWMSWDHQGRCFPTGSLTWLRVRVRVRVRVRFDRVRDRVRIFHTNVGSQGLYGCFVTKVSVPLDQLDPSANRFRDSFHVTESWHWYTKFRFRNLFFKSQDEAARSGEGGKRSREKQREAERAREAEPPRREEVDSNACEIMSGCSIFEIMSGCSILFYEMFTMVTDRV